jgi:predicted ribonuclease YlaK
MLKDGISLSNDAKIISCARHFAATHPEDEVIFVTNDLICRHIASMYFTTEKIEEEEYDYEGYKEVYLNNDEMTEFYTNQDKNLYDLHINEYLLVYNTDGECVDRLCWTGDGYRHLSYTNFNSRWFGEVKPMKGDVYQSLAADSLANNKITLIKGPAGSGKTFLSLAFLIHKLERNRIDKIIVFCNTVATKNSAKLGYYPGTRDEKLLDSQIGNLLISKFGGRLAVEQMIQQEKLVLLPLSDIRGYDTSGMAAGIYISEAQNMDVELMKLTLQRIGEDSICIIDGDCKTQVDDIHFAGSNNGMRRASQVYRGEDIYGEITLKNIHRSRIAQIAEKM